MFHNHAEGVGKNGSVGNIGLEDAGVAIQRVTIKLVTIESNDTRKRTRSIA